MYIKFITPAFILCLLFSYSTVKAQHSKDSCCTKPDSLTLSNITDSSFCMHWHIVHDTAECDTATKGMVQWKPADTTGWTSVPITYNGSHDYTYCFYKAKPDVTYQWRVRDICMTPDTTITGIFINGKEFTTLGLPRFKTLINPDNGSIDIFISPNPAISRIHLQTTLKQPGSVALSISNFSGKSMVYKTLQSATTNFTADIDISQFERGVYLLHLIEKNQNRTIKFIKQ